jgi:hypothetical protein
LSVLCRLLKIPLLSSKLFSNKNTDIKCSAHDAFLEKHPSGTLNIDILESQIHYNCLGTINQRTINRIVKIVCGHP